MKRLSILALACAAGALAACSAQDGKQVAVAENDAAPAATAENDPRLTKADQARIHGSPSAKAWFVIISDFQCPYCKQWHDTAAHALRREYVETGKVRVAYVNYPLGQHQQAVPTAEAAMCAGLEDKFWAYHDALFDSQKIWSQLGDATALLDSLAGAVGLNVKAHKECRDKHVMLPLIAADRDRATAAGARSTPTFIVNGQALAGVYPMTALRPLLDAAVAGATPR